MNRESRVAELRFVKTNTSKPNTKNRKVSKKIQLEDEDDRRVENISEGHTRALSQDGRQKTKGKVQGKQGLTDRDDEENEKRVHWSSARVAMEAKDVLSQPACPGIQSLVPKGRGVRAWQVRRDPERGTQVADSKRASACVISISSVRHFGESRSSARRRYASSANHNARRS